MLSRFRLEGAAIALVACLGFSSAALAQADPDIERRVVTVQDADYHGYDIETLREVSLDACIAVCLDDRQCKAFTYNANAGWCFLKSDHGELQSFAGAVAGRVVEVARQAEALPRPDLSFLPDWLADEAQRYAGRVRDARSPGDEPVDTLTSQARAAMGAGDTREAAERLRAALALAPDDWRLWRNLADAILATEPRDYSEQWQLRDEAVSTAYGAVIGAKTAMARAEGFALLARALTNREMYRPALEAYKASLALVDDSELRTAYEALREQHGFRVTGYTVESDSASPRICVQVSENLLTGRVDYTPYVTVDGVPPQAVAANHRQLCVEGVRHGQRYRVTVRAGLPSSLDEVTLRPVELNVYVRDRASSVRFTGRNFVLPRVGSRGIPLVSINSEAIELQLYRIGERGLAREIVEGRFLDQMSSWQAEQIDSDLGTQVWTGTLEVRRELNREVTSIFPVDEALPERRPGVYVLRARAEESEDQFWQPGATQWFIVSDIGLLTFTGDSGLDVFVRSIDRGEPLGDVTVRLVARNNEVLGEAVSDASGRVSFDGGLARGSGGMAPGVITAELDERDFAFLDLTRPGFDLSDRGVAGRAAAGAMDIFLYTERGVYRPGETVHLTALMRDDNARAIPDLPLTFVVSRPDGVEDRREVSQPDGGGAHQLDLPMIASAMRGPWRVTAHAHADGPALADIDFLVEDFVPDRIEFDLSAKADVLPRETPITIAVDGRFLYGAPAAELRLEGTIRVAATHTRPDMAGYQFGLVDDQVSSLRETLADLPHTDEDGVAAFDVLAPILPTTTRPLEATVTIAMREAGGRAVERRLVLPVEADGPMIGIRPLFDGGALGEGAVARFDVASVAPDGSRIAMDGLEWELVRIQQSFQWYRSDGSWNYEPVTYTTRVADGTLDVSGDGPARLEIPVESGRYRLEITGSALDGPATSLAFTAGWYAVASDVESPDLLEVSLDRPRYAVGETARFSISPRFAGIALVAVVGEGLIETREVAVGSDGATVELEVGEDWAPGAYVTATLFRPGDAAEQHMPARAVGLTWLEVDATAQTLEVALDLPDIARPHERLTIPATVTGLAAGERAHLTVAAVDVGILNLTGYEPPRPEAWYFGQRRLAMEMRDLYGSLIDGLRGETGRLRAGGSDFGGLTGSPPVEDTVALFSGIVVADAQGRAAVTFDLPQFNGTLRVMAVAWSPTGIGHGTSDLIVRDPVVVTASLPRFLAPGDESRLRLDIDNADGPAGNYSIAVDTSGHVRAGAPRPAASVELDEGARHAVSIPLTGDMLGDGQLTVRLTHDSGLEIVRNLNMAVRPAEPPLTERRLVSLAPGQSLRLDGALAAGRLPGSAFVTLSITQAGHLDLPSLLHALDRWPYGCAEQITSRGLPLLYLSQVAQAAGLGNEPAIRERVRGAIRDVLANQSGGGSFGVWGPGGSDLWLNAYVTDFLTRARETGYDVPVRPLQLALDNLSNTLGYTSDVARDGHAIAYALYVLARNQRAAISDLRYYADTTLDRFATPLAKAQLGAALALYGESERASRAFGAAYSALDASVGRQVSRADYGSPLRDGAAILTLAVETRIPEAPLPKLMALIEEDRAARRWTSTQENAWLLLAAHALLEDDSGIALEIDGQPLTGNLVRRYSGELLDGAPVSIHNTSGRTLDAVLAVTGVPNAPIGEESNGFEIDRRYFTLDGTPVDPSTVAQNDRLVVVLEGREANDWPSQVLVVDMLPSGFEIDNPRLVQSGDVAELDWLDSQSPAHVEFRDDRFVAAFDRAEGGDRGFLLAYVVRAVSPGRFVHPPATVEDMYRPYLSARTATSEVEVLGPQP